MRLHAVDLALRGEEQHPVVGGGGEHVLHHVLFLEVLPANTAAPASLATERVDRQTLHVPGARDRDDHVLLVDEVLEVEVALVRTDLRATCVDVLLTNLGQLHLDDRPELLGVVQQGVEVRDPLEQFGVLLVQLCASQLGQASQRHVQDVVGLDLRQLELLHQGCPRSVRVRRGTDHLDHFVQVIEGDQEPQDDVVALLGPAQVIAGSPGHDVHLVVDVVPDHLGQVQRAWHAVHQRQHDDAEGILELGLLIELVQHHLRVRASLAVDDQPHPVAVGFVFEVGDVLHLAGLHQVGDLLCQSRLVHLIREFGDDDLRTSTDPFLDLTHRANLDGTAARLVRVADTLAPHHGGARREVRSLHELHEVF